VASSAPPPLTLLNVSRTFPGGTVALEDTDLVVEHGEFVSIVGPSGCGKSTLLRIISGLDRQTAGSVTVHAKKLGYVFQDATLLPWRSVFRNVELFAELDGLARAERHRRVKDAIELVGLQGFERHRPRALSGGMRMRVSLARSLVLEPDLFLFDEPFGALDEMTRQRLNEELVQLFTSREFASLFITHSVPEAVFLSHRVAVMSSRPGRIVGEVQVPFSYPRQPAIRFTEEFALAAARVSRLLRDVTPA
jgi:NitT/TauT family transport system ATP-binding protein